MHSQQNIKKMFTCSLLAISHQLGPSLMNEPFLSTYLHMANLKQTNSLGSLYLLQFETFHHK